MLVGETCSWRHQRGSVGALGGDDGSLRRDDVGVQIKDARGGGGRV